MIDFDERIFRVVEEEGVICSVREWVGSEILELVSVMGKLDRVEGE